jgi:hypothetical protein
LGATEAKPVDWAEFEALQKTEKKD